MAYSDLAVAFTKISVPGQVRLEDRASFVYIEYAAIYQDRTGVWAASKPAAGTDATANGDTGPELELIQVPVGSIAVVMLGPGTSVTQPAMASMANAGATVVFTGGGGLPMYAAAVPLTASARWAQAQATLWSDPSATLDAAKVLYARRFPDLPAAAGIQTLESLRGMEGRLVRSLYQHHASKAGIHNFRRDSAADDPVNIGLNIGNQILYGCAASACATLAVNPALGIIHRGNTRALLFDLADVYKSTVTIPAAFRAAQDADPLKSVRRRVRAHLHQERVLQMMVRLLTELLTPYLGASPDSDVLLSDDGVVQGHTNYALDDSEVG